MASNNLTRLFGNGLDALVDESFSPTPLMTERLRKQLEDEKLARDAEAEVARQQPSFSSVYENGLGNFAESARNAFFPEQSQADLEDIRQDAGRVSDPWVKQDSHAAGQDILNVMGGNVKHVLDTGVGMASDTGALGNLVDPSQQGNESGQALFNVAQNILGGRVSPAAMTQKPFLEEFADETKGRGGYVGVTNALLRGGQTAGEDIGGMALDPNSLNPSRTIQSLQSGGMVRGAFEGIGDLYQHPERISPESIAHLLPLILGSAHFGSKALEGRAGEGNALQAEKGVTSESPQQLLPELESIPGQVPLPEMNLAAGFDFNEIPRQEGKLPSISELDPFASETGLAEMKRLLAQGPDKDAQALAELSRHPAVKHQLADLAETHGTTNPQPLLSGEFHQLYTTDNPNLGLRISTKPFEKGDTAVPWPDSKYVIKPKESRNITDSSGKVIKQVDVVPLAKKIVRPNTEQINALKAELAKEGKYELVDEFGSGGNLFLVGNGPNAKARVLDAGALAPIGTRAAYDNASGLRTPEAIKARQTMKDYIRRAGFDFDEKPDVNNRESVLNYIWKTGKEANSDPESRIALVDRLASDPELLKVALKHTFVKPKGSAKEQAESVLKFAQRVDENTGMYAGLDLERDNKQIAPKEGDMLYPNVSRVPENERPVINSKGVVGSFADLVGKDLSPEGLKKITYQEMPGEKDTTFEASRNEHLNDFESESNRIKAENARIRAFKKENKAKLDKYLSTRKAGFDLEDDGLTPSYSNLSRHDQVLGIVDKHGNAEVRPPSDYDHHQLFPEKAKDPKSATFRYEDGTIYWNQKPTSEAYFKAQDALEEKGLKINKQIMHVSRDVLDPNKLDESRHYAGLDLENLDPIPGYKSNADEVMRDLEDSGLGDIVPSELRGSGKQGQLPDLEDVFSGLEKRGLQAKEELTQKRTVGQVLTAKQKRSLGIREDAPVKVDELFDPETGELLNEGEARINDKKQNDSGVGKQQLPPLAPIQTKTPAELIKDSLETIRAEREGRKVEPNKELEALLDNADESLPTEAATAIQNFVGHLPGARKEGYGFGVMAERRLEDAMSPNPSPEGIKTRDQLENSFKPIREQLRQKFGDNVELFRVQGEVPAGSKPRNVLSYTLSQAYAKEHAGVRKESRLYSDSEITNLEKIASEKGEVVVGNKTLKKNEFGSYDIYDKSGNHITDTDSVSDYINDINESSKVSNETNNNRASKITKSKVSLDDVVWATNRAGQWEFIVKNKNIPESLKASTPLDNDLTTEQGSGRKPGRPPANRQFGNGGGDGNGGKKPPNPPKVKQLPGGEENPANPTGGKATERSLFDMVTDLPKELKSSMDISFPFRQGLFLLNRPAALKGMGRGLKNLVSEKGHLETKKYLGETWVNRERAKEAGLAQIEYDPTVKANTSEEFGWQGLGKLPGFKHTERSFIDSGNLVRANMFDEFTKGKKPDPEFDKGVADYLNTLTGRTPLPKKMARISNIANKAMWSPRFVASRVQLLNPAFYAKLPKEIQKAALRDVAGTLAAVTLVTGGIKAVGDATGEDTEIGVNPLKGNFGYVRTGKTSYNLFAGLTPLVKLYSRLTTGRTEEKNGTKRLEGFAPGTAMGFNEELDKASFGHSVVGEVGRFARGKESPALGALHNLGEGKDYLGQEFDSSDLPEYLASPLAIQDFIQAYKEGGLSEALKTLPGLAGVGVQVQKDLAKEKESKKSSKSTSTPSKPTKKKSTGKAYPSLFN